MKQETVLRKLPKIDSLLRLPSVEELFAVHGRERVASVLREMVDALRAEMASGSAGEEKLSRWAAEMAQALRARLDLDLESALQPVINATGVLLHTNLGRSPLSVDAIRRMASV